MTTTASPDSQPNPSTPSAAQSTPAQPQSASTASTPPQPIPPSAALPKRSLRKWIVAAIAIAALAMVGHLLTPRVKLAFDTVSTDDAYVNGHVTFVAPRVPGQIATVFVDDNYRVKKGDLLVQLDKEPYLVQVEIKKAALVAAEADLIAARAQVQGQIGTARSNRFALQHAIESVNTQIANLSAAVATLNSSKASADLAKSNLKRGQEAEPSGGISVEELDQRQQTVKVTQAVVAQALQQVYAIRVGLGLPAEPPEGKDLTDVPPNLSQHFSAVRQALGTLLQSTAQFGYFPNTWTSTPEEALAEFNKQDPDGNVDRIFARLIPNAPAIKQAEAKLLQAHRDLNDAELNLRYCDVVSLIDGVVTRRNANPGDNVTAGQSLMAVRSLTEIWIDANFKETQLADLRIGQLVRCDVDMYGSRRKFEGRITGFTMGTGQTLALLPPQNATGNYVKIVQRLPVRIELTDYKPEVAPLFVGLSVTPYVYFKEAPTGPRAGEVLQPLAELPTSPTDPMP